jgi:hypothetical protein
VGISPVCEPVIDGFLFLNMIHPPLNLLPFYNEPCPIFVPH